jgi:23S rRNA pseudouridine1911/1915/1917 synthase
MNTEDKPFDPNEGYEHYRFVAAPGQEPLRVDKFLHNFIVNSSRNKISLAAKHGHVIVNGEAVAPNYKVKPGDEVQIVFEYPPYEHLLVPEDIPIDIVFEDDQVIVVNKAPNMVVHPGHGNYTGTLINAVLFHYENLPTAPKRYPGLIHRIDKETSGLIVLAKTEEAMASLGRQFYYKKTARIYYALVWGNVEQDEGTIVGNVGRHPVNRMEMAVFPEGSEIGKEAVTHYRVVERFQYVTLVMCKLETGRTHQIRVHMKHIGHTLFNDSRYGGNKILKGTTFSKYQQFVQNCFQLIPRQALHAKTLGFEHPITRELLHFDSELPADFQAVLEKWRNYSKNSNLQETESE